MFKQHVNLMFKTRGFVHLTMAPNINAINNIVRWYDTPGVMSIVLDGVNVISPPW